MCTFCAKFACKKNSRTPLKTFKATANSMTRLQIAKTSKLGGLLAAFLEERSSLPLSIILTEISLLKKRGHYSKVEHYVHVSVCVCACVCVCITITVACTTNTIFSCDLPPVNVHITGKSPFSMGKSTISMAIFNSFLLVYQAGYIWNLKPKQNSRTSAEPWHLAQSRPEQKQSAYDLPSLSAGGRAWLVDWLVMIGGFKWVAFERKMGICMFWLLCVFIVWYIYIHIYMYMYMYMYMCVWMTYLAKECLVLLLAPWWIDIAQHVPFLHLSEVSLETNRFQWEDHLGIFHRDGKI